MSLKTTSNPTTENVPSAGTTQTMLVIYTPKSPLAHPRQMVRQMFSDLVLAKDLAWRLAVRDISAQYRQTLLGFTWALILPIINTVTWIFLNRSGVVSVSNTSLPYPVYVFTGTMLWQIFVEAFQFPSQQVNSAKEMLSKVNFPKEAIILSGIMQTLFNASIKILLLVPALLFFGIKLSWSILLAPLGVVSLILAGTAMGLLLAPISALYQDVTRGIAVAAQFWMYITPVVFPLPQSGWVFVLFKLNPLTPLILTTRDWLTAFSPTALTGFGLVNVVMFFILLLAWLFFRISMPILVERMSV
jgi:lipopolysaccharide transport system permease protein